MAEQEQLQLDNFDRTIGEGDVESAFIRMAISPSDVYDWRSVRQIANALGVSKSPSLRTLLNKMYQEGKLEWTLHRMSSGVDMYLYRLVREQ